MLERCHLSPRRQARLRRHVLSRLVCLGSHSITGLLATSGRQFEDWTADYRFYARRRVEPGVVFDVIRRQILADHPAGPLVVALDDTLARHTGRKIPGAKHLRDPLSPPFHVNLVRANRFLQLSMAYATAPDQARMIPIDLVHAPPPDKPKADADPQAWRDYRRRGKLPRLASQRLDALRQALDEDGQQERVLWAIGDGGYTNRNLLKTLPPRTSYIGRIRGDAKLYALPEPNKQGRKRIYGEPLPTPEALRKDETVPWREVTAFAAGRRHKFRIKTLDVVRWRACGKMDLRILVIAPLRYRLRKGSRCLYRQPAYLVCTDPGAPLEEVLQHYLWRWDIEVNFRDEKSLLGIEEAKVRDPNSVETVPALGIGAYGLLLLAGLRNAAQGQLTNPLALPKWRRHQPPPRLTTSGLITHLRHELWRDQLRKTHFAPTPTNATTPQKPQPQLSSALFYTTRTG